jgi:hypothetical protein
LERQVSGVKQRTVRVELLFPRSGQTLVIDLPAGVAERIARLSQSLSSSVVGPGAYVPAEHLAGLAGD